MLTSKISPFILALALIFIPLYPKFPLLGVPGSFVSIRFEDLLIACIFILFLFTQLKTKFQSLSAPLPRSLLLYLAIGFIAAFSGIFLTKTASLSLGLLHSLRRVEYAVLFFAAFAWLNSLSQLRYLVRVIIITSLLVALYGLGQQFLDFPVVTTTNSEFSKGLALSLGPGARINSTFAGHYDLAAFSVFPLLLIIALLPISSLPGLLVIGAGMIYWTLLLSASRITFVSFFVAASALILLIRKPFWLLPLFSAAFLGVFFSPQLKGRYLDFITNHLRLTYIQSVSAQVENKDVNDVPDALKPPEVPEDRSFNIRLKAEWPKALRAFTKNPVLGTGFSSVGLAVDNDYLRTLAETGLLGLAAFVLIFLRFFKSGLPFVVRYTPSVSHAFIVAITCSVLGLLINAVFIDVFAASKIAMFTWAVMGLAERTKLLAISNPHAT
ncbi:hypothetical protein A3H89_02530 [Candidatus Amesbacteria bacterium RIFCSPLOWO2_02_FULL_48_11]|uniref:O-antigen ligase-related domain-containing protein n=5 Tax=Candidatus Amesiibacteriota TaxID=1752730 RepID=A0A1F4ZB42_9BACT|nr:MAG: hypothetical protein UX78_C0003G0004 [Candidatus Amesbacteria bacterium GW2011_GWA2_47_11]KKU92628.1 MAG: hypothetical protein UY22_C0030G0003 [Candidatus Amesbacteria bacterium GW2011_GWC1_48_10]KKU99770.1 MAG: hypothetical protein UY33_C0023G0004 [Candidatus Amesbacteria bacterium GW2011_GWA1_48_9]OGC90556.1 MAG: hypothetical protein A2V48_01015 [Candidatus Amesbacteria bacterium RBG_19FT_COMBO_48_16]OGC96813.1 MAG: hypothetical protein A3C34_00515 [Candidatus Amesbacteria bacterium R